MIIKTPTTIYLLLILIGLFFSACQKSGLTVEPTEPVPNTPTIPFSTNPSLPTQESLNAIDLVPGFNSGQIPLSEGKSMIYSISVPENIGETPVPLIIALHGGNGDSGSSENFMECLPLQAFRNMDAIIFAPTGGQWWNDLHSDRVVEFVRLAKLHWPIDTNKVAVTGYSNGGTGSVHFAKHFPNTFTAAIPMGADYMDEVCPVVPTYMIHGSLDQFYTPATLKRIVEDLQAKNCDIQLHFVEGANHGGACQMVGHLTVASIWLEMEAWKE